MERAQTILGEMSDEEFLDYADGMADTPRCGFVPAHLARLNRLAGRDEVANAWGNEPNGVVDADRHWIRELVAEARRRLKVLPGAPLR